MTRLAANVAPILVNVGLILNLGVPIRNCTPAVAGSCMPEDACSERAAVCSRGAPRACSSDCPSESPSQESDQELAGDPESCPRTCVVFCRVEIPLVNAPRQGPGAWTSLAPVSWLSPPSGRVAVPVEWRTAPARASPPRRHRARLCVWQN
jgi:hypothetical protein